MSDETVTHYASPDDDASARSQRDEQRKVDTELSSINERLDRARHEITSLNRRLEELQDVLNPY